ncbi:MULTISPECIES: hypothetical protein [Micrococcaceae]|jgi:hypothetical protein|uniref:hypothetical protein n=1 Tax=Micrococcaceae TaxID=1268 RepID=UPI0008DD966D|nr:MULTISPECIES: hypothetical protein [Micrococcaceae]MDQ0095795.1 ABC-type antimicrobial peptide transport system permease subunit [Paeniglutamicibacter psychrophenolicus]OIH86693.1 hypothetical protein BLJ79_01645 [Arthrobacter sp. UCD-GKA]
MSQHTAQPSSPAEEAPAFPTGTLVFGLILLAIGIALLAGLLLSFQISAPLLFIGLVAGAGLILVIAGIMAARRSR